MKKILFLILCLCSLIHVYAQQDSITEQVIPVDSLSSYLNGPAVEQLSPALMKVQADSAYMKNDYATAIQLYENMLEHGEAAEVYYNLGNSYYKSDDIARAILNYERALLLKPDNADIRANLEIARNKTVDKVDEVPEIFFISWIKSLINIASVDAWAKWGIAFFILFIFSFYFFVFSKKIVIKKTGFICAIAFLIFTISANLFASYQNNILLNRNTAIITSPSVTVRSTPNENGTSLFILHEGRKVQIKDNSMSSWKEISLEDGKVGWVQTSELEVI